MKRRTVLAGLGSLTASSALAVGSGAFTSVSADRTVTVETADDNQALLGLEERGDGEYGDGGRSLKGGDTVSFSFPGVGRRLEDPEVGLGVDSVYVFVNDGGESAEADPDRGLARVENQGTQPVEVYSVHRTDTEIEIELFDVTDSDRTALRDDPVQLGAGEFVDVGFRIRTFDADVGEFDETLTVVADQPGD